MKYQNEKDRTIIKFIKKARRRISTNIFLNSLLIYLSAGFLIGTILNIIAIFVPIYQAFIIAAVIVSFGALIGIIFSILKFPSPKKAALLTDKTGLEERLITSYELCGKKTAFSELQKENTVKQLENFIWKERLPLKINNTYLIIFLIFSFSFGISAIIPSQAKEDAIGNYKIKKITKEEIEKVEKVKKELEKIDTLSEAEKEKLKNLFDKTIEELKEIKEEKEIKKAKERLGTKLEKQLEKQNDLEKTKQLENLAKSLDLPNLLNSKKEEKKKKQKELLAQKQELEELKNKLKKAGKLTQKEINDLKKLAASLSEEQLDALLEQLKEKLDSFELSEEELKELENALENAANFVSNSMKQLENQEDNTDSNISFGKVDQNLNGNNKQQGQNGNAQNQNGSGNQNIQGNKKGLNGQGMGQGWNYGSKKGIEKKSELSENPEQVIIPDKEQGQDKNLTGKVSKNGNSYTTSSENGLTWAGEKVDYRQVVSDYTEEAYSKIENNKVPEEMKEIIKSYFEELNQ